MNAARRGAGRTLTRMTVTLVVAMALLAWLGSPAHAQSVRVDDHLAVDFYYSTFGRSPTLMLFAGGTVQDFCVAGPDGTGGGVAKAPARIFTHDNGIVDIVASAASVPIHVYEVGVPAPPVWLEMICPGIAAGEAPPAPFASGHAPLKARITEYPNGVVDVFNGVSGGVTGADGRRYDVRAWADFVLVDGMPQRSPDQFVSFQMTEVTP